MTRNTRNRRGRRKSRSQSTILIVLCLLVATGVAASFAADNCSGHNSEPTAATDALDADALLKVTIPDDQPQEILPYPGFTVSFNPQAHEPNYVAWELLGAETDGAQVRKNFDFQADESVYGSATPDDYRRSGFDRGHMAPAADMKWSADAMRSCFYMTNMCPQDHALNGGAWKSLEDMCRNWAIRDSAIMIVCGPVLSDRLTQTIGRTRVAVPERFFKVVLAPYANPPRAIGFIMNNGRVRGGVQTAACSVDDVERVTGYDFFSALPDDVEDAVEQQNNLTQWQYAGR